MVGTPGLSPPARRRLLALVLGVVLAHALALHLLSRLQWQASLLRPMVAPMYTRLLEPEKPVAMPATVTVAEAPPAPTPGRMQAAPSTPPRATRTVAKKEAEPLPAPAPVPAESPPVAQAPEPPAQPAPLPTPLPAPAPTAAASTPSPAASSAMAAASTPSSAADSWPTDTRVRYRLGGRFRSGELYGDARVLWQRDGARYQVRVEVDVTFMASLVMTSQGQVGATLQPEVYEEVRNRRPPRGLRVTGNEVVLANGNVTARPAGVQDTASQFVELSHRFATGREKLQVGRAVSFWMARPGALDLWTYDIVESEVLRTKLGDIEAFHLKPRPISNPRGNITAEMWFAPALQYLPVRIRVNMGEEASVDLLVEAIDQK